MARHEHVGLGDQPPQHLGAVRAPRVEREAALVAVDDDVERRVPGGELPEDAPHVVAGAGLLQLDDVGTLVAEQHPEEVADEQDGGLDHLDPAQQAGHGRTGPSIIPASACSPVANGDGPAIVV